MESTEADGQLQIDTECWIEPQIGFSINNKNISVQKYFYYLY